MIFDAMMPLLFKTLPTDLRCRHSLGLDRLFALSTAQRNRLGVTWRTDVLDADHHRRVLLLATAGIEPAILRIESRVQRLVAS